MSGNDYGEAATAAYIFISSLIVISCIIGCAIGHYVLR